MLWVSAYLRWVGGGEGEDVVGVIVMIPSLR